LAPELFGPRQGQQALGGQLLAEALGDGQVLFVLAEGAEEAGRDALCDQLAQRGAQLVSLLAELVVQGRSLLLRLSI
jgi:hypothetical protein